MLIEDRTDKWILMWIVIGTCLLLWISHKVDQVKKPESRVL